MLLDLRRIEAFMQTACGVMMQSGDLCSIVRDFLGIGPVWGRAGVVMLEAQVAQLLDMVKRSNSHFLSVLLGADEVLNIAVVSYPYGSWAEAVRIVQCVHFAWAHFPSALEYVRTLEASPTAYATSQKNRKRRASI